jgi:hypothetical protein
MKGSSTPVLVLALLKIRVWLRSIMRIIVGIK